MGKRRKTTEPPAVDSAPVEPALPKNKYPVIVRVMGRPSVYSQYLADIICGRLTEGDSLRKICRDDDMPCTATIFSWFRVYPDFLGQYTRAVQNRVETHVEEMLEISDDSRNDTQVDDEGNVIVNHDHIQRSRLRVDTRKWIASKLKPRKYGEKIVQEHSGPGGKPIEVAQRNDLIERLLTLMEKRAPAAAPKTIDHEK